MTAAPSLDRLTASDLFMMWDDYGWCADVGALAVLDGDGLLDGDGRVRIDAVRTRLGSRLPMVPRFRQLLSRPRRGLGWPVWVDATSFDIADHVHVHPLTAAAGEAELLAACQLLAGRPFDATKPLWELWLLPGLPDRRLGAYLKLHHALGDGAAGVAAFGALLDLDSDAADPPVRQWNPAPAPTTGELLGDNVRRRGRELARGLSGLTHPRRTVRTARQTLPAWREVLAEERAPATSLNRPVGTGRRLALVRCRLDESKQIAHAYGAKVNDVVLAAVAGGLRELLAGRGEDVQYLVLRAMVPISLHREQPGQAQGNQDSWMMVPLPLGEPDPLRRLTRIAAETAARKDSVRPPTGSGMFRFLAAQRAWYRRFPQQRSVSLVVTNVAGPPVPLYLAGARMLELAPVVSVMGNLTLVVAVLSYDGQIAITAVADATGCPDLDVFVHGVRTALDEFVRCTPLSASEPPDALAAAGLTGPARKE
jgi:WS/DGAT/MGAT family acyltransferase